MSPKTSATAAVIAAEIEESVTVKRRVLSRELSVLGRVADTVVRVLRGGGKVLLCGNGGSAADSQHVAAELVSRFRRDRQAFPAVALSTDTSILTSVGNDYGFEHLFERQVEALGAEDDMVWGFSTSGESENVIRAVRTGDRLGLRTVGFTGAGGGRLAGAAELCFRAPSDSTARIQEVHLCVAHAICEFVERELGVTHEEESDFPGSGRDDQPGDTLSVGRA